MAVCKEKADIGVASSSVQSASFALDRSMVLLTYHEQSLDTLLSRFSNLLVMAMLRPLIQISTPDTERLWRQSA